MQDDWVSSTHVLRKLHSFDDRTAWLKLDQTLRPRILAFGRRRGLSEDQAQEVAQNSLLAFAVAYRSGRYDRTKGPLRRWIFGFVNVHIAKLRTKEGREANLYDERNKTVALQNEPTKDELEQLWDAEWKRALMKECLREIQRAVKPQTFQLFEETVLKGKDPDHVAKEMNLPTTIVYNAKYRVSTRLGALIKERFED